MAHRSRWFTYERWVDFPWRTVSHNQMVSLDIFHSDLEEMFWTKDALQVATSKLVQSGEKPR